VSFYRNSYIEIRGVLNALQTLVEKEPFIVICVACCLHMMFVRRSGNTVLRSITPYLPTNRAVNSGLFVQNFALIEINRFGHAVE
jgi:hypothetical protein